VYVSLKQVIKTVIMASLYLMAENIKAPAQCLITLTVVENDG